MAPMINPNFEENPKVAPGTYEAKIISCEQKISKKNTPYLNFKFEIVMGQFAGQWVYLSAGLSGKGAQILKSVIQAAFQPGYESGPIDTDNLLDKIVLITVERGLNPDGTDSPYPVVLKVAPLQDEFDSFSA